MAAPIPTVNLGPNVTGIVNKLSPAGPIPFRATGLNPGAPIGPKPVPQPILNFKPVAARPVETHQAQNQNNSIWGALNQRAQRYIVT